MHKLTRGSCVCVHASKSSHPYCVTANRIPLLCRTRMSHLCSHGSPSPIASALLFEASADGVFSGAGISVRCAIGRGGVMAAHHKREGDGASPIGDWTMRRVLYRPDHVSPPPQTALPLAPIAADDGWCDAPDDAMYNRPVKRPYAASHECMWRDDELYDIVVVLGHNDDPIVPGMGSAIFLHIARPDYEPTAGCIALTRADLESVLRVAGPGTILRIKQ